MTEGIIDRSIKAVKFKVILRINLISTKEACCLCIIQGDSSRSEVNYTKSSRESKVTNNKETERERESKTMK